MPTRLGLFGGSFDPVHCGHLIVAGTIAERLHLDRVILLPSATPPHKHRRSLADPDLRSAMVRLAIENEPLFSWSDFDLTRVGPTYTIDTVTHFATETSLAVPEGDRELSWIIGADWLADIASWHRAGELIDACQIVTAARAGWEPSCLDSRHTRQSAKPSLTERQIEKLRSGVIETPVIEISSTDIRERVRSGLSIRYLVPDSVRRFIEEHQLYRDRDMKVEL